VSAPPPVPVGPAWARPSSAERLARLAEAERVARWLEQKADALDDDRAELVLALADDVRRGAHRPEAA
jgi:hypothetical protein